MESKHGRCDDMEERIYPGSHRQRSRVPRARYVQQSEFPEFSHPEHQNGTHTPHSAVHHGIRPSTTYLETDGTHTPHSGAHHGVRPTTHQDTDEFKEWQRLIGERVCISGVKQGLLRYYGRTDFAQGFWCGVELDEPVGKHNGTVNGIIYFVCKHNHGIFAPVSKVYRLNDFDSDGRSEERRDPYSRQQATCQNNSNWDFGHLRYTPETVDSKFIKNSPSDPTFARPSHKGSLPHKSESFPHDRRSITQQRERHSYGVKDMSYNATSKHVKQEEASNISVKNSSCIYSKYGYGAKNQTYSSSVMSANKTDECKSKRELFLSRTEQKVPKKSSAQSFDKSEDYEHFHQTTKTAETQSMSSDTSRFSDMAFFDYKMKDDFLSGFQSRDFPDPEDEMDNDDQMSGDYDESLGILSQSQMDCALWPDLRGSYSDLRGIDIPNSESFDDINELPEDEQVHDVSVQFLPESSSAARVLEIAKNIGVGKFAKDEIKSNESKEDCMTSSTDKFLLSISQKAVENLNIDTPYDALLNSMHHENTGKLNNLSAINILSYRTLEKTVIDKFNLTMESHPDSCTKESVLCTNVFNASSSDATFSQHVFTSETICAKKSQNLSDNNEIALRNYADVNVTRKNYETDSSRDSLLQVEPENNVTLKEKLTVSWEDCVSQSNDCTYNQVERPESVYTVASTDTGFHEDVEMDVDVGMATSLDSTEGNKRFSTASRDSCIVTEEVDGYKLAESNSTSGYSTGLSDSCCNDRPDDEMSSKRLTDEEILDSVGHCDSEDAFSFNENSFSKDCEIGTAEISEITVENITVLGQDSTSDALCDTMVEDPTLTEIHDLLMSPEENNQKILEDKENNDVDHEQPKDISESSSIKTTDRTASSISAVSTPKSTPEKKLNIINRTKTEQLRAQRAALNKNSRSSRVCDEDSKKQIVRSPKKNVMSKIKAIIGATSCKTANKKEPDIEAVQKRVPTVPKKSRWESVTSKIAASLAEEKTKPKVKREIKGRVDTNLSLARQQASLCKSPKLGRGDGTMSPVSVSSRKPLSERNSAPNSLREDRVSRVGNTRDPKQTVKSPRPSRARITSRSNSPVAPSESSTSISLTSHNSKSKISRWKGSNSTVASSAPPPSTVTVKRQTAAVPPTKPPLQPSRVAGQRTVAKKTTTEQPSTRGPQSHSKGPVRPPMWLSKAELTQEIQRLGTLCESRTKELNRLKMETKHVSAGFDAFAALFKYMVEDLNALSVPNLTEDLQKTLKQLELTKQDLAFYERKVEEMESHHSQELNDLSNKLFEVYQGEVAELNAKQQEEINILKSDNLKQIEVISAKYEASSAEAIAQADKMVANMELEINKQREELELFHERELRDIEEKTNKSTKLLQDHINQLQKKCAELERHSLSMEDAMQKDTDSKLQWVSAAKSDLEKEVESLKAVLEMKNKELHTLRVQNLEMEKQLEELPIAREKIKMLQARAEDLEALMVEKTNAERKLCTENQEMRDTFEKEAKINRRLSMENETLQWRLREAEKSIISGSFSEGVSEFPEVEESVPVLSPTKSPSPQVLSRSVFFTFMDKEECATGSPRTPYKKITPGFSSGYKTSPAKSSKSPPVPQRPKSHSEPPQPPIMASTPRKSVKLQSSKNKPVQKRQRSDSAGRQIREIPETEFSSVTDSMASSFNSECSMMEPRLLDEHKEQIIHSLEILREQRRGEHSSIISEDPTIIEKRWSRDDMSIAKVVPNLETEDMSRSAEFSDPKTYYHMTFPVLKESNDNEDGARSSSSAGSPVKEVRSIKHSKSEDNLKSPISVEAQVMSMSMQESHTTVTRNHDTLICNSTTESDQKDSKCENGYKTL